jgi:hypothetical protein
MTGFRSVGDGRFVRCTIAYMEPVLIVVKAYYFAVQQTGCPPRE